MLVEFFNVIYICKKNEFVWYFMNNEIIKCFKVIIDV